MRSILILTLFFFSFQTFAQKKELTHDVYATWNSIKEHAISNDGQWVKYRIEPGKGDPTLKLVDKKGKEVLSVPRGTHATFSWNSKFLVFTISPQLDSVNNMRRRKVEEKDLPKDSLAIVLLEDQSLLKIPNIKKYSLPEKWSEWIVYELEDSTDEKAFHMVLRELETGFQDTLSQVTSYKIARKKAGLIYQLKGDSTTHKGVYVYDFESKSSKGIFRGPGNYAGLCVDDLSSNYAFMVDLDTTKHLVPSFNLAWYDTNQDSARIIMDLKHSMLNGRILNEHDSVYFSKNTKRLFFGISDLPVLQDTSLLEEEITTVEVWSYTDDRLHTQQNIEIEKDKKKAYLHSYDLNSKEFSILENHKIPEVRIPDEQNSGYLLGISNLPYRKFISWEGYPLRYDIFQLDMDGNPDMIRENVVSTNIGISPNGNYAYWYDAADTSWNIYSFKTSKNQTYGSSFAMFANELNDLPNHPYPYGIAGWTEEDESLLVYDRFDLWELSPESLAAKNLTKGRASKKEYRYVKVDPLLKFIPSSVISGTRMILKTRNTENEKQGLAFVKTGKNKDPHQIIEEDMRYNAVLKAHLSDEVIYSKENFKLFPDLQLTNLGFKESKVISNVNPQQKEYFWGSTELYYWTSLDGQLLKGILAKPENFDPSKKYPLLVNFYERNSDNLHNHRHPTPGRSTINYSFYTSRGYVIFNPDIPYRVGYPGESCYNAVVPGVTALIGEGFIDKERIGVQGHSWGGYQVSYLVTKTDLFSAAEAGAPVPNMISAYGGIRWWTGLSRMFQYEHTQSRIGGTLWEYPIRFIENSPIFFIDKINTPLLIMHNDKDGHVPWYQGIELFVALRRLQKPSWMLNYSGEPHWPLAWQNRVDFNIRMQQFFDHYLKDAPMPRWMQEGIPATEKGINLGYELD